MYGAHRIQLSDNGLILCWKELENLMRTNKQTDREQTENSKPDSTLIPMDRRGEQA